MADRASQTKEATRGETLDEGKVDLKAPDDVRPEAVPTIERPGPGDIIQADPIIDDDSTDSSADTTSTIDPDQLDAEIVRSEPTPPTLERPDEADTVELDEPVEPEDSIRVDEDLSTMQDNPMGDRPTLESDLGKAEEPADDPFGLDADQGLPDFDDLGGLGDDGEEPLLETDLDATSGADMDTGKFTEHEQQIFDDLSDDPYDDPFGIDAGVPEEYDLSGGETESGSGDDKPFILRALESLSKPMGGDKTGPKAPAGPTNSNPVPGYKYDPVDGSYVKLKEGEVDPDRTTAGEEKAKYLAQKAAEEKAKDKKDDWENAGWNLQTFGNWIGSWFGGDDDDDTKPTPTAEDRDPDSATGPHSPTMDPSIAEDYTEIQLDAERNSEIQYADMPEDGSSETIDYDGIDYGEGYAEPDFDVDEATQELMGDPMDQPDVDPIDN